MPRKVSEYLRTTEILSFVNASWYQYWVKSVGSVEECERIGKESREFGTGVHRLVEGYLVGECVGGPSLTPRQHVCAEYIQKWLIEVKAKPIILNEKPAIECELKSEKYKYTGHPDLVATFGESPVVYIIDWKTSKNMKAEYKLQLAAYAQAIKEMYGIEINNGAIIITPNDPNVFPQFEVHEVHDLLKTYWPVFKQCLEIVQFFKNKRRWRVKK